MFERIESSHAYQVGQADLLEACKEDPPRVRRGGSRREGTYFSPLVFLFRLVQVHVYRRLHPSRGKAAAPKWLLVVLEQQSWKLRRAVWKVVSRWAFKTIRTAKSL